MTRTTTIRLKESTPKEHQLWKMVDLRKTILVTSLSTRMLMYAHTRRRSMVIGKKMNMKSIDMVIGKIMIMKSFDVIFVEFGGML